MGRNAPETVLKLKGQTPLHVATIRGCILIMESLLSRGADMEAHDKDGRTPLELAFRNNQLAALEMLVSQGADIHVLDQTSLAIAASLGLTESCKRLLTAGAATVERRAGSGTGSDDEHSALFKAARGSFTAIVDMIMRTAHLDQGASGGDGDSRAAKASPPAIAAEERTKPAPDIRQHPKLVVDCADESPDTSPIHVGGSNEADAAGADLAGSAAGDAGSGAFSKPFSDAFSGAEPD